MKYWSYLQEYKKYRSKILKTIDLTLRSGNLFFGKELKKFENAIESFKKAIEIEPNDFEAHNNCGNLFFELGKYPFNLVYLVCSHLFSMKNSNKLNLFLRKTFQNSNNLYF